MAQNPRRKGSKAAQGKKPLLKVTIALLVVLALAGGYLMLAPNTGSFPGGEYLYIKTGSDYDDVRAALQEGGFIRDMASFDLLARQAGYPDHIHAGKYHIPGRGNNYQIVRLLRSGKQTPVKLVIGKLRRKEDFIRLLANNLEADSVTLRKLLSDTVYLAQFGLKPQTMLAGVLPDTYEFYWNTGSDKAFRKIEKTASQFWTAARQAQAKALGLSEVEATVVASIIEEETNNAKEKPLIASVYLNRLKTGMKLQADPTARWAGGDFTIRRITAAQTSIASPYNTYHVAGLPPGPICTPSRSSIDAVLKAPKTNYIYFCAKEDFSGTHRFAATYAEHQQNARRFQEALNARNIH